MRSSEATPQSTWPGPAQGALDRPLLKSGIGKASQGSIIEKQNWSVDDERLKKVVVNLLLMLFKSERCAKSLLQE